MANEGDSHTLTHVCLITEDVPRLARWYAGVLGCRAEMFGEQYAEVPAPGCTVSFFRWQRLCPPPGAPPGLRLGGARSANLPADSVRDHVEPDETGGCRAGSRQS